LYESVSKAIIILPIQVVSAVAAASAIDTTIKIISVSLQTVHISAVKIDPACVG
jgi:hypothetical protein